MTYSTLRRDLYFGIATLGFSCFFILSIFFTVDNESAISGVSSRTFPYIIAASMSLLSLSLILSRVHALKKIEKSEREYIPLMDRKEIIRTIYFICSLVIYVLGFVYLGYFLSTTAYILFWFYFMGAKNKLAVWIMTFVAPGAFWFFFVKILGVQFPETFLF